jgi:hypothetical protein
MSQGTGTRSVARSSGKAGKKASWERPRARVEGARDPQDPQKRRSNRDEPPIRAAAAKRHRRSRAQSGIQKRRYRDNEKRPPPPTPERSTWKRAKGVAGLINWQAFIPGRGEAGRQLRPASHTGPAPE